jgi:hypothetical protein
MKDANDRDPVIRDTKVNHVPFDMATAIPLTDMATGWSGSRRFGQHLESRGQ